MLQDLPSRVPFLTSESHLPSTTKKNNVCKTHRCVSCCYDTEMPLLNEDLHRILALGFEEAYFAMDSRDGFKVLRNSASGRCVFHDGKQCTIYANRPAGCRLYPLIFNENSGRPVRDRLCPYRSEFAVPLEAKRALTELYVELMDERQKRMDKNNGDHLENSR